MPAANSMSIKRETLNLRIKPAERDLIDRAAKARGKNRTDFVLEAARAAAEEALIEQRIIMADPQAYQEFLARLDQAPAPKEGANKQVISSQADSLIKISRIWADFFPANTSNQPI
ncbi:DUF1778 domain-containing protein [Klebsiella pneumoniae]